MNKHFILLMMVLPILLPTGTISAKNKEAKSPLRISMQQRLPSNWEDGAWIITNRIDAWKPSETVSFQNRFTEKV
ncbi:hypothetical protein EZS27_035555 [termite gut metagenome]|uniref:Uncharacterized protein n=1 Tax=termite gut metagenome TaxID=433724 RepID=A0A5J4PZH7_9ZZZZ